MDIMEKKKKKPNNFPMGHTKSDRQNYRPKHAGSDFIIDVISRRIIYDFYNYDKSIYENAIY